jgi:ABC-type phosphonate transport system ATPase subunit
MSYVQKGKARNVYIRQNEGSLMDVEHAEMVEKQLDAMIQRRARKGDVDPDEREELWKASVRAYEEKRRQMARAEWHLHHTAQAERLRRTLEGLIAHHESAAARLMEDEPEGAG